MRPDGDNFWILFNFRKPGMPDNINKVMITNATRNNTTASNILFVGDNVISQGISFSGSSGCFLYNLRKTICVIYVN